MTLLLSQERESTLAALSKHPTVLLCGPILAISLRVVDQKVIVRHGDKRASPRFKILVPTCNHRTMVELL